MMNRQLLFAGIFGTLFGFAFAGAGLNQYDTLHQMLLLENFEPYLIMASAIATAMPILFILERKRVRTATGNVLNLHRVPVERKHVTGGLIFGAGWAVTGACPGTASTAIGPGSLMGIVLFAGMLSGMYLRDLHANRSTSPSMDVPGVIDPVSA